MASHYEESLERDVSRIRNRLTEMANLATDAMEACISAFALHLNQANTVNLTGAIARRYHR